MIKIDGSHGTGGGQILRSATALAAISQKPCQVFKIRKGKDQPGLKTQHLLGLRALAELSSGFLEGDKLGSKEIKFYPGSTRGDRISINIPTAGSITLALQGLLPVALKSPDPVQIIFKGGATDTFFSPSFDYFQYVLLGILQKMGLKKPEIEIQKRGFYPKGGAELKLKIFPSPLNPISLTERGKLKNITLFSGAARQLEKRKVAQRQISGVKQVLGKLKLPIEEKIEYYQTACPGTYICALAEFENTLLGADNLGKLGKPAEKVGKEVALQLLKEQKTGACLDRHMADQILPFLALTGRKSKVTVSEITEHCKTNIWVIEKFLDGKFKIKDNLISWNPE